MLSVERVEELRKIAAEILLGEDLHLGQFVAHVVDRPGVQKPHHLSGIGAFVLGFVDGLLVRREQVDRN